MDFKNKAILIAGASSGIGRAVALKLAAAGARLVVTARRKDRLETLASEITAQGGECLPLTADALDEQAAEGVVKTCVERYGQIDMALLNAGGAPPTDMMKISAAEVKFYVQNNFDVMVNYLFPVLEQMKIQRSGLVAHTNSMAGFIATPLQGPYCAAKGAARLLIDSCRVSFAEYGIKFTSLYPGFTATDVMRDVGLPTWIFISEEKCADHILYALRKEKADYFFPTYMHFLINLARILPKPIVNQMLKRSVSAFVDRGT